MKTPPVANQKGKWHYLLLLCLFYSIQFLCIAFPIKCFFVFTFFWKKKIIKKKKFLFLLFYLFILYISFPSFSYPLSFYFILFPLVIFNFSIRYWNGWFAEKSEKIPGFVWTRSEVEKWRKNNGKKIINNWYKDDDINKMNKRSYVCYDIIQTKW